MNRWIPLFSLQCHDGKSGFSGPVAVVVVLLLLGMVWFANTNAIMTILIRKLRVIFDGVDFGARQKMAELHPYVSVSVRTLP